MVGLVLPARSSRPCVLTPLQRRVAVLLRDLPGGGRLRSRRRRSADRARPHRSPDPGPRLLHYGPLRSRPAGAPLRGRRPFRRPGGGRGTDRLRLCTPGRHRSNGADPHRPRVGCTPAPGGAERRRARPERRGVGRRQGPRIFGRAEARDFADLAVLEPRFGLDHLCALATRKEAGFDRSVLLAMLDRFDRLDRDEFDIGEEAFATTLASVDRWRNHLRGGSRS